MTFEGKTAFDRDLGDAQQIDARRRAACQALGIDPATIVWSNAGAELKPSEPNPPTNLEQVALSDGEWGLIAPLLPEEAPQMSSMSNRAFLEAVLTVMRRGGAWASRHTPAAEIEAVRRRFGRWAHQEVFQRVAAPGLALSPESKRLLALAGQRAAQLKSRTAR